MNSKRSFKMYEKKIEKNKGTFINMIAPNLDPPTLHPPPPPHTKIIGYPPLPPSLQKIGCNIFLILPFNL